ncbi:DUF1127 domain-containing protein [Pararhodobacter aggregans]|uniref:YjiS-like domain-containing protein n=1 Tax=Pararhodobacter aggregans TaxID=404875 RepID=A0A2T7ULT2_9RHOB|nr:DUF1127 domain-containing protein [Pararhodobacter aggregans]PTX02186.1 uncharacterized protein YjiS (DUF1127 family) [Pararhodobacter aggregans]PVE45645.1 hypothetical protein DDE23_20500 [Pararhodobacter aggregans]
MASSTCTAPVSVAAPRRPVLARVLKALATARALRRQRVDLAALDDQMLADIGLSREEAQREARRPLWDAPSYWR